MAASTHVYSRRRRRLTEPSGLSVETDAVLDGRVSFEQKTSRAGVVRTRIKVMSTVDVAAAVLRAELT